MKKKTNHRKIGWNYSTESQSLYVNDLGALRHVERPKKQPLSNDSIFNEMVPAPLTTLPLVHPKFTEWCVTLCELSPGHWLFNALITYYHLLSLSIVTQKSDGGLWRPRENAQCPLFTVKLCCDRIDLYFSLVQYGRWLAIQWNSRCVWKLDFTCERITMYA